jgi:dienelactone hydrolase
MVVKYRTQPPATDGKAALDDARRAMRIVRHRAGEWGIDPARIGMLGGSAGANLVLRLFTSGFRGDENAADAVERESCRPAFAGLLCPWPAAQQVADFPVTKDTPPMFLCSARDDTVAPTAFAEGIAQACEKAGVPACRLWIIERGGHAAFRLDSKGEGGQWADRFTAWLRENTFDKGAAKHALQREARLGAGGTTSLSFVDDRNGFLLASSDPAAGLMTKNIYATTDGGATWQPRPSPDAHSYYATGIAFRSSAEGWITGTYHGGDACPLYHTRNGAGSWALQKLPIPDEYRGGYADSYPPVFIGEDRGHGYLPVKLVRHDPPPGHWAWVNYESDDGGATWHLPAAGVASLTEP